MFLCSCVHFRVTGVLTLRRESLIDVKLIGP